MPDPSREVALACQTPMAIAVAMGVGFNLQCLSACRKTQIVWYCIIGCSKMVVCRSLIEIFEGCIGVQLPLAFMCVGLRVLYFDQRRRQHDNVRNADGCHNVVSRCNVMLYHTFVSSNSQNARLP